jgi:glycine/D-amino acid oxidase-like deaminating enzyme
MTIDCVILGGGFYGVSCALYLTQRGLTCAIIEREARILLRASFWNQARVHGGYHYPRSVTTALRSQKNYKRFCEDYAPSMHRTEHALYAVSSVRSLVTAEQFHTFCKRIDAPIREASQKHTALFNANTVRGVFEIEECTFNAGKLQEQLECELKKLNIPCHTSTTPTKITRDGNGIFNITLSTGAALASRHLIVSGYAGCNELLSLLPDAPPVPLKLQLAELALVKPPQSLAMCITVMDGPFFSLMPFPSLNLFSFSHVAYTPRYEWDSTMGKMFPFEKVLQMTRDPDATSPRSSYIKMLKDTERYLPSITECAYEGSFFEMKAFLPRSAFNDSRPILFSSDHGGIEGLHVVIGSKMDNIYDCFDQLETTILRPGIGSTCRDTSTS